MFSDTAEHIFKGTWNTTGITEFRDLAAWCHHKNVEDIGPEKAHPSLGEKGLVHASAMQNKILRQLKKSLIKEYLEDVSKEIPHEEAKMIVGQSISEAPSEDHKVKSGVPLLAVPAVKNQPPQGIVCKEVASKVAPKATAKTTWNATKTKKLTKIAK